jgi:hypothetical protein
LQELEITSPTVPGKKFITYSYPLSWSNARIRCRADGGDIATVLSQEEQNTIVNRLPGRAMWIGLNDISAEGTFVWADGSDSKYTNWHGGQPDNWMSNEDCAHFVDSGWNANTWNDNHCDVSLYFLCAKCGGAACIQVTFMFASVHLHEVQSGVQRGQASTQ